MTEPVFTLYHSPTSVCSQKVRLVMAELGLSFESRILNLQRGDQFDSAYIRLNPDATVPTLLDNGKPIFDSNEIIRHLCSLHLGHDLIKASRANQGCCDYWLTQSLKFHDHIHTLTYLCVNRGKLLSLSEDEREKRFAAMPDKRRSEKLRLIVDEGYSSAPVYAAIRGLRELIAHIDEKLRSSNWICGQEIAIADYAVFPFIYRLRLLGIESLWISKEGAIDSWIKSIAGDGVYEEAVARWLTEAAVDKFATHGAKAHEELRRASEQIYSATS